MKPWLEIDVAIQGFVMSSHQARFSTWEQYRSYFGPYCYETDTIKQYRVNTTRGVPYFLIVIASPDTPQPSNADSLTDGVAHAWGSRLNHLGNKDILDAISKGVEEAFQARKPKGKQS